MGAASGQRPVDRGTRSCRKGPTPRRRRRRRRPPDKCSQLASQASASTYSWRSRCSLPDNRPWEADEAAEEESDDEIEEEEAAETDEHDAGSTPADLWAADYVFAAPAEAVTAASAWVLGW